MRETTLPLESSRLIILPRAFTALLGGAALFFVMALAVVLGYQITYQGLIFPGVTIAGIPVGGKRPEEVRKVLRQQFSYPQQGRIAFYDRGAVWTAKPADLGFRLDERATAEAAYRLGRRGDLFEQFAEQFSLWTRGTDLPLIFVYDERLAYNYLSRLAEGIYRPTIEASLGLNGSEVFSYPGQVGRKLNIEATLEKLSRQLHSLSDGLITLVVDESPPLILDASGQAALARQILSAPLVLTLPGAGKQDSPSWRLEPETLAGMLSIERVTTPEGEEGYQVGLDSHQLTAFLESIAPSLEVQPVNARFTFNDETRELELLQPAVVGRSLMIPETAEAINRQLAAGEHTIELLFDYRLPAATDEATAAELGVTELVSEQTTYFYGSSAPRIHNIATAASRFHGLLVAPGETFSMAQVLGDISLDTGYAEALIIFGDRTIQGVGGGVCQVSTTLFRTVFFGGFQIDERYSHAYRVYYYELNASGGVNEKMAGLDATVYVPLVDFKFTNDTPYWLLMETYVNTAARSLTWKFYSTSDGRTVEWSTTGLQNREEPPDPLYLENPDLAKGEIRQVDWAVDGADVTVTRVVRQGEQVIHNDIFKTHYSPWRAVYEYGPGTKGIPKQKDE